jgi:putative transposase
MNDSSEVYYVVLRGAGRQPMFNDDEDRRHFTRVVAEAAAACGVTVHAYCWLQSEARLAVQTAEVSISQFAGYIADKHARRLKRGVALAGSSFEQTHRGVRVDGSTDLPDLVRHIHLAPLKAGLTDDLSDYPWSSHLVYIGLESAPWVTTATTLRPFADSGPDPRRGYIEFMKRGVRGLDRLPAPGGAAEPEGPDDHIRKRLNRRSRSLFPLAAARAYFESRDPPGVEAQLSDTHRKRDFPITVPEPAIVQACRRRRKICS